MLERLIRLALEEDLAAGDVTSAPIIAPSQRGVGVVVARQSLRVAGLEAAQATFAAVDPGLEWLPRCQDGDPLEAGSELFTIAGPLRGILEAERTALNFLQRLSGIATFTAIHVAAVAGTTCRIADTRKTLPGWRALEKHAVRCGGGVNHRFHLGDGVLIKDNHVAAAGGVSSAVTLARQRVHHLLKIEVECDTLEQVSEALEAGVDAILLDNMTPAQCRDAVERCAGRVFLEASGGIVLANVAAYAATGIDQVALGAITHSAPAVDIGLDLATV